ncbi:hypothetical protein PanWU01x14_229440 [Parasponia andersonii]|uniref:AT3G52170-like helix-turn-helix domain-containing protein n=1 Tax=Parasponia andersonii TaxID=3476 RepID=A0A2P5BL50_PARAD|nr:hypothetical protein PanWU01x14_229440 [Parasponia andersonii]
MHAVNGGWVGQTFALAKSNESEGRKFRIRRSKEERKAMVESFIKKYQKLNNGSFPSLNLTHKEVGGSFYTVREIVRDIIQENRVLGPAKLSGGEKRTNQLEEYPLGSIATAPYYPLTKSSNDSQLVTNEHQGHSDEPNLVSDGHHTALEDQMLENGQFISVTQVQMYERGMDETNDAEMQGSELVELEQNGVDQSNKEADLVSDVNCAYPGREMVDSEPVINGSLVEVKNKEFHETTVTELRVSEPSEAENVEDSTVSRSKVTPIAENVTVETFPLRPVTRTGDLKELTNVVSAFGKEDLEKVELAADVGSSQTDRINSFENSSLMDGKEGRKLSNALLDKKSGLVDEKVVEKHNDPLLERLESFNGDAGPEIQDFNDDNIKISSSDVTSVTLEKSQAISEAKAVNSPNGINVKYLDSSGGMREPLKTEKKLNDNGVDAQQGCSPQKGSNPTLDRINLESWGGSYKNPAKPEGNPVWAVFKAFINAFVKFWSE